MSNGRTFVNQAGGRLSIQNDAGIYNGGGPGTPAFTNAGTISKTRGGVMTINVPVVNSGTFSAQAGSVNFGNVTNNGTLKPTASPGDVGISGTFIQSASGSLNLQVGGSGTCSSADQLQISNSATLGGTLNVSTSGCTLTTGQTFTILRSSARSGTFGTVNTPRFTVSYPASGPDANGVVLTAT